MIASTQESTSQELSLSPLSAEEALEREVLESELEEIIKTDLEPAVNKVRAHLTAIYSKRLYRSTHSSFQEYTMDVFGKDRTWAYRHIQLVILQHRLVGAGVDEETAQSINVGTSRVLSQVSDDKLKEVVETAKQESDKVTASSVKEAIRTVEPALADKMESRKKLLADRKREKLDKPLTTQPSLNLYDPDSSVSTTPIVEPSPSQVVTSSLPATSEVRVPVEPQSVPSIAGQAVHQAPKIVPTESADKSAMPTIQPVQAKPRDIQAEYEAWLAGQDPVLRQASINRINALYGAKPEPKAEPAPKTEDSIQSTLAPSDVVTCILGMDPADQVSVVTTVIHSAKEQVRHEVITSIACEESVAFLSLALPDGKATNLHRLLSGRLNKFVVPTIEEIEAYLRERAYEGIDAEEFFAAYDRQGWKLANGRAMTSWKGAIVTWVKSRKANGHQTADHADCLEHTPDLDAAFERFVEAYPKAGRVDMKAARSAWEKKHHLEPPMNSGFHSWDDYLVARATVYSKSKRVADGFVMAMANWISQERWLDADEAWGQVERPKPSPEKYEPGIVGDMKPLFTPKPRTESAK